MKAIISLAVALCLLIGTGACMMPELYRKTTRSFEEQFNAFLMSQDGKQLIIIGKNYHYIFDNDETLQFILTWSENKQVQISFNSFVIDDAVVYGSYNLTINTTNTDIKNLLLSKGFHSDKANTLIYNKTLHGTRYLTIPNIEQAITFNKPYYVTVRENVFAQNIASRILLTPLALGADGVLLIGAIPVMIIGTPVALLASKIHSSKPSP